MRIVEFSTLPQNCPYLENRYSRMDYKFIENCSTSLNNKLVKRGWRRFGRYFSRPNCESCKECINLKIDVNLYEFSKSTKRVFSKNKDTKIVIQNPTISTEYIDLYRKYHKVMEKKRGWKYNELSLHAYYELYVAGSEKFGKEVLYFLHDKLIGVDLIDLTDDGFSSIYFFYDPDYSNLSLGKYSIYQQILLAKLHKLSWIYLGYYVKDCPSLCYKAKYKPYKLLSGSPQLEDSAIWV